MNEEIKIEPFHSIFLVTKFSHKMSLFGYAILINLF